MENKRDKLYCILDERGYVSCSKACWLPPLHRQVWFQLGVFALAVPSTWNTSKDFIASPNSFRTWDKCCLLREAGHPDLLIIAISSTLISVPISNFIFPPRMYNHLMCCFVSYLFFPNYNVTSTGVLPQPPQAGFWQSEAKQLSSQPFPRTTAVCPSSLCLYRSQ